MESAQGTIIRLTRLTETSLIVHWFTGSHGLMKTVAKGARRPKHPLAGRLDLFFNDEIEFQWSRRGELHTLREANVLNWREGLRKAYASTLLAAYWCQLLEAAVEPEHPEPALYDLLNRALDHVDVEGASRRALLHFERELARLLGVRDERVSAEHSLHHALGSLPPSRAELIERLF